MRTPARKTPLRHMPMLNTLHPRWTRPVRQLRTEPTWRLTQRPPFPMLWAKLWMWQLTAMTLDLKSLTRKPSVPSGETML